jgi:outer membrane protein OmpA-like peptidoglycan-associated protein
MYQKEDRKTSPTGIRFSEKKLAIALGKSKKKTTQQLVDFLIDKYVNGENYAVGFDPYKTHETKATAEIIKKVAEPIPTQPQLNQRDAYAQEMNEVNSYTQLKKILNFVDKDNKLSQKEKIQLNQLATFIQQDKGLYNE